MSATVQTYRVPALPDLEHHRLQIVAGGDVQQAIFAGFEQLLRTAANFGDGQLTLGLRFLFTPSATGGLRDRLRLFLIVRANDLSPEVVQALVQAGPLAEYFHFMNCGDEEAALPDSMCSGCEIIRFEERLKPLVGEAERMRTDIPKLYYSVQAFTGREDNTYLLLDRLLSRCRQCCAIEILARSVNQERDLEAHYRYIRQLMSVNQYGGDLLGDRTSEVFKQDAYGGRVKLEADRKRDPIAAEILREQEELHRTLRKAQLHFTIKTFAQTAEEAFLLVSAAAESAFEEGSYRILTYGKDHRHWEASLAASARLEIFDEPRYAGVWDMDLPKAWRELGRLCRLASVDELKSAFRLPLCAYGSPRCIRKQTDPESRRLSGEVVLRIKAGEVLPSAGCIQLTSQDGNKKFEANIDPSTWDWDQTGQEIRIIAQSPDRPDSMSFEPGTLAHSIPWLESAMVPARMGGTILVGHDYESEEPPASNPDLSVLRRFFREQRSEAVEIHLPLKNLCKHLFVAGVPGSGKTVSVFNLLVQLHEHGIPFLVIEPAKTEYRVLKTLRNHPDAEIRKMAKEVRVWTPGNEDISPFRFNPFDKPKEISTDEHIGNLLTCFRAAMPLGGPLEALLAEAVEAVYESSGARVPRMDDLVAASKRILESKSYEGEVRSNLRAAIEVRLGLLVRRSVGQIFRCTNGVPAVPKLLAHPTIVEMDALSQEHACLLTLFLLSAIREQIRVDPSRNRGDLRHVIVVEEAHNIVGRSGPAQGSEENANPKAFAAEFVARMLAELRALGEGMVIADQLPSAVAPEVIKNTGTKIANRLVSKDDREDLGATMLLGPTEIEELARLSAGEAYFYTDGFYRPRRVRGLNASAYLRLPGFPNGRAILSFLAADKWYRHSEMRRIQFRLDCLMEEMETLRDFIEETERLVYDSDGLYAHWENVAETEDVARSQILALIQSRATQMRDTYRDFLQRRYNPVAAELGPVLTRFPELLHRTDQLERHFEAAIAKPYARLAMRLQKTVKEMKTANIEEQRHEPGQTESAQ